MIGIILATALAFSPTEWREDIPPDGLTWKRIENGVQLKLSARGFACGGDGFIAAKIPLYAKGRLEFDYRSYCDSRNRTIGPFLSFYNVRTFFHDACKEWRAYFPEPQFRRETDFPIEPSRHWQIGRVEPDGYALGAWTHCRIDFDREADRVEFFVGDMSDPAFITGDRSVWGAAEIEGGELRIGGMGGSKDGLYEFANIVLTERKDGDAVDVRTETLVFDGFASSHFTAADRLAKDNPRVYVMDPLMSDPLPRNRFKFSRLPGSQTLRRAKRIVLVDASVGPDDVIPAFVLSDMVAAVEDGAEMIVLEGLVSLTRGEYAGTPLEKIMPEGTLSKDPFAPRPARPEIVERKVGKGVVKVFHGFNFPETVEEARPAFDPWAEKLFGTK